MTRQSTTAAALLCLVCVGTAYGYDDERARRKHNEAMLLWDLGLYGDALIALKEGYKLNPETSFIINAAYLHKRTGELELKLDNRLDARRHFAMAADIMGYYRDRLPPGDPRRAAAEEKMKALNHRVETLGTAAGEPITPKAELHPPIVIPQAPPAPTIRQYTAADIEEADRAFGRSGLGFASGGAGLAGVGVGFLCGGLSLDSDIKDAFLARDEEGHRTLTGRQKAFYITGAVALTLGVTALSVGVVSYALPTKYRVAILTLIKSVTVGAPF